MSRVRYVLHRRPFALSLVVLAIVLGIGVGFEGVHFVTEPLPLPHWIANVWLTCNMVFAIVTCAATYRNLLKYEEKFNWQETFVLRGICWLLLGMSVSYFTHLVTGEASVTIGTIGITVGILCILYGALSDPDRFIED